LFRQGKHSRKRRRGERRAQIQDAMAIVAALENQSKAFANLSLHSQRLSRQFERTVVQLRELQRLRRYKEEDQLDDLLDVIEMHESKGETYRPSDDGFVFSPRQIHETTRARNRKRLIKEARQHRYEAAA
jgi:hypothetical protein